MNESATGPIAQRQESLTGAAARFIPAYIGALALAEIGGLVLGALFAAMLHAAVIVLCLVHSVLSDHPAYRRFLPALSLLSLMRILSLALPLRTIPQVYWNALAGLPVLVAVLLVVRLLKLRDQDLGLSMRAPFFQGMLAFLGLPLSLIAYFILQPKPLTGSGMELTLAGLVLILFVGFLEELMFRGVLLRLGDEVLGGRGLLVSSVLFAIMYLGSFSPAYALLMAGSGVLWGWVVKRTGSIWGAVLAHAVLSVGLVLYWPLFFA